MFETTAGALLYDVIRMNLYGRCSRPVIDHPIFCRYLGYHSRSTADDTRLCHIYKVDLEGAHRSQTQAAESREGKLRGGLSVGNHIWIPGSKSTNPSLGLFRRTASSYVHQRTYRPEKDTEGKYCEPCWMLRGTFQIF